MINGTGRDGVYEYKAKRTTIYLEVWHVSAVSRASGGEGKIAGSRMRSYGWYCVVLYKFGLRSIMDTLHCERFDGIYMKRALVACACAWLGRDIRHLP